jgi:phospholipase/carboxylesterase
LTDLHYEVAGEDRVREGGPVVVLLHGRGSDEKDLLGLSRHLPATWTVIAPRAPFPAEPWGYGPGWAWYQFLGGNRPEPDGFAESLRAVSSLLRSLPDALGFDAARLVLGGFSQGGTVSLALALATTAGHLGDDAPRIARAVNLSGFLADHPLVRAAPETVSGVRMFWGHGTADPAIPFGLAVEGREALRAAGADLETHDYPAGHWIEPKELRDLAAWVDRE